MKRSIISLILILALTNQAFAMGWLGGGGGAGSSAGASSGGKSNSNNNSNSISNNTANNPIDSGNNGLMGSNIGGTEGQGSMEPSTNITASTPELTTMFLLGSALFVLWGLKKKIRK